jgi:hypothetical protein
MYSNSESIALIDLFASGLRWLKSFEKENKSARFTDWKNMMKAARPNDKSLDDSKLIWLWHAITTEPSIKNSIGNKIVSLDEEWKGIQPFECLPKNSRFGIFFRGFQAFGYPLLKQIDGIKPDAEAEILGPLFLRPGKAKRLECCDAETSLRLHLPEKWTKKQEALAFKVEEEDIDIEGDTVEVRVKSLNHAYTKASLRLQPHRRGHGGKSYFHVAHRLGEKTYEPLEEIRLKNERRIWKELKGE